LIGTLHQHGPTGFTPAPKQTGTRSLAISLDIVTEREPAALITVYAWHLPVTESLRSRHNEAVTMSNVQEFDLREWLVPPIVMSLFFSPTTDGALIRKTRQAETGSPIHATLTRV
jgi:hypothetical protein